MTRRQDVLRICKLLQRVWLHYPQLRFGQIVTVLFSKVLEKQGDLFYVPDSSTEDHFRAELRRHNVQS